MKLYTLLFTFFICSSLISQNIVEIDINSARLGESRILKIFVPEDYSKTTNTYPLTVVLDADDLFDCYVSTSKLFAKKDLAPSQIIVGISQNIPDFKLRDYGYNNLNSFPTNASAAVYEFINKEVLSFMKSNYRVGNFKTLVGQQLTGNFTSYFFMDAAPSFNAFININPEFALDMPNYLFNAANTLKGKNYYYYMSNGNNLGASTTKLIADTNKNLLAVNNVFFNYKYEAFNNSEEITAIPQSIASALDYVFLIYSKISKQEFEDNVAYLSPLAALEYLQYKYENIEYLFDKKINIRKEDFIKVENIIIDQDGGNFLRDFSELALVNHPKDPMGDYYAGMYYEKKKDYKNAILTYKKGYAKIPANSPKSSGFFTNIERVSMLEKLKETSDSTLKETDSNANQPQ